MNEGRNPMPRYLLALDQGTTSSRAILFDEAQKNPFYEDFRRIRNFSWADRVVRPYA